MGDIVFGGWESGKRIGVARVPGDPCYVAFNT